MRESIPDIIIERAAHIWAESLRNFPSHQNGDESLQGGMTVVLATLSAARSRDGVNDLDGRIDTFETKLVEKLKFLREHDGEETGGVLYKGHPGEQPEHYRFPHHIGCDYDPDAVLSEIAAAAEIPANLFSWKSEVWMGTDHVSESFGRGTEDTYHYPVVLGDGKIKWLICKLRGSDMTKVIAIAKKSFYERHRDAETMFKLQD